MPYADKTKRNAYAREWVAKRRCEFFKDKFCVVCGSIENLTLDHKDPVTKVDHRIWSWAEARQVEELKKCQVLCYRCHRHKTNLGMIKPLVHGTRHGYDMRNCRCPACKEVNRKHTANWRASNVNKKVS